MTGRHHLVANIASAAIIIPLCLKVAYYSGTNPMLSKLSDGIVTMIPFLTEDKNIPNELLFWMFSVAAFVIGTWLPDIDNKNSIMGKFFYLPVKHRTWTHTIYPVILIALLSRDLHPFYYMAIAYFLHLFWDSLSTCGVAWFFPLTGYVEYGSGAKVKKGHHIKLYKVGNGSETAVLAFLIAGAVIINVMPILKHLI